MALIHDQRFFTEESLRRRAERYGFSNLLPLELFVWDIEIAAQVQRESNSIILKGGAAAQLHLPVELQRGSVDVDLVGMVDVKKVEEVVRGVADSMEGVVFRNYRPRNPVARIPLSTYHVAVPSIIPREDRENLEIKAEILMEELKLPTYTIEGAETFALETAKLRCYGPHVLIGDKILTLAHDTVGMRRRDDYPKQIYDTASLLSTHEVDGKAFKEIMEAVKRLVPLEASYRRLDVGVSEVMEDIQETMGGYATIDTGIADSAVKRDAYNFQQLLLNTSQRGPWHEWSARALTIRFMASLVADVDAGRMSTADASGVLRRALETGESLGEITGEDVGRIRNKLMEIMERRISYYRELRGKPLTRVFWEVVDVDNLGRIKELL